MITIHQSNTTQIEIQIFKSKYHYVTPLRPSIFEYSWKTEYKLSYNIMVSVGGGQVVSMLNISSKGLMTILGTPTYLGVAQYPI